MSAPAEFDVPEWVTSAFATARALEDAGNAYWLERLGDPGNFGGFQVAPCGPKDAIEFESVLFGGRSCRGSADEVRNSQRAFVNSRIRRKRISQSEAS